MSSPIPQPVESRRTALAILSGAAWWLLPVLFLLWLYKDGLFAWFLADDFAWLNLIHEVHSPHDLMHAMFAPMAQGTIRPWSERGFFMAMETLFGLDALPFRIVVFATAAADLVLISWLARRMTGSRVAGFAAPILWASNSALVRAMTWSSSYNEIMCPLFLLTALALFIRFAETGRLSFWWWQMLVFTLGFGALEINVVYPVLAGAWVLLADSAPAKNPARRIYLLKSLLPLAATSAAYYVVHRIAAPLPTSGAYALHLDRSIFRTLVLYWKWALAPEPMERFGYRHFSENLVVIVGTLAIAAFIVTELRKRRLTVLFCLVWFIVTLAPMLPLSGHRTDYYITIPVIGTALLGAAAVGEYWYRSNLLRGMVAIPILVYLWAMVPVTRGVTHWWFEQSVSSRAIVLGVRAARATHPGKAIVLDGVTTQLFNLVLGDSPFAAAEIDNVYLTTGSELNIKPDPGMADLEAMVLEPAVMAHAITHNDVVVYSLESDHLRNITGRYTRSASDRTVDRLPTRVDVGNSLYAWLLGPTWLPAESGFRWMPGRATLRMGVPATGGSRLEVEAYCPEAQLLQSSRHLIILIDGVVAVDTRIYDPESSFKRLFSVPAVMAGKSEIEVEIRVDPVARKNEQDYGLIFGKVAIRP
jgi:hypothetical protein